jgi:polar amino acid transport system permease protein/polar amino acid transport system substrate-binding protein
MGRSMDFIELVKESMPSLLDGLLVTVKISVISLIIAVFIGLIFGLFNISKSKILKAIATVYIFIIRGTPLIVQALFLYFGVGQLLAIKFDPEVAGIIVLSLNAGAYMAEIFRGGILAVEPGQMEAARSLGFNYFKSMRKIILPQAIKVMIPSIINQFIVTIKDTSILTVISIRELTQSGQIIIDRTYKTFEIYGVVAIMYFILITVLTIVSQYVERKLSYGNRS